MFCLQTFFVPIYQHVWFGLSARHFVVWQKSESPTQLRKCGPKLCKKKKCELLSRQQTVVLTSPSRTSSQHRPPRKASLWSASARSSPAGQRVQLHENVFNSELTTHNPKNCGTFPLEASIHPQCDSSSHVMQLELMWCCVKEAWLWHPKKCSEGNEAN